MIYVICGKYDGDTGYLHIEPYTGFTTKKFTSKKFATLFDDSVDSFEAMVEEHLVEAIGSNFKLEKIKLYDIDELVNL